MLVNRPASANAMAAIGLGNMVVGIQLLRQDSAAADLPPSLGTFCLIAGKCQLLSQAVDNPHIKMLFACLALSGELQAAYQVLARLHRSPSPLSPSMRTLLAFCSSLLGSSLCAWLIVDLCRSGSSQARGTSTPPHEAL